MLGPLIAASLAAAPFSVAMPDLNAVNLAQGEGTLYSQMLAQKLASRGVRVVTSRDFAAVMGLERQQQLLQGAACTDSCITELAAAMGVDALLVGDIGKPATAYAMTFKLLGAKDGAVLAIFGTQVPNADGVSDALDRAVWTLLSQLKAVRSGIEPGPEPGLVGSAAPAPSGGLGRGWAIVPAAVGVVALGVGTFGLLQANGRYAELKQAPSVALADSARDSGKTMQTVGWLGVGVGVAAVAAGAVVFFLGSSPQVAPTVSLGPGAASVGIAGTLP